MGCNPSKESQVATGNTVNSPNLEKRPSNDLEKKQSNAPNEAKIEEITDPIPDKGEEIESVGENAAKKDVEVNTGKDEVKVEETSIAADSRDKEVVEGVVASVEISPENTEGPKMEETETVVAVATGEVVEEEKDVSVGEEEEKAEEENGEPSSIDDSADLKETILVEELDETEAIATPENRNGGEEAE